MGSKLCYQEQSSLSSTKADEFILQFNACNNNVINKSSLFDARRVVFVSLTGVYNTWRRCPSFVLYSSLLILPLNEKWIDNPEKYQKEIELNCRRHGDLIEDKEFIQFLKWKHSQGLIFWLMNDFEENPDNPQITDNNLVSGFWADFNAKLTSLYDPVTGGKYKSIPFAESWWKNEYKTKTKFDVKASTIFCELYFSGYTKKSKYKAIQEILYQSNPLSLNPIISYTENQYFCGHVKKVSSDKLLTIDEFAEDENMEQGNWCVVDSVSLYGSDVNSPKTPTSIDNDVTLN